MLHKNRVRNIKCMNDVNELAKELTQITWVGCQGFKIKNYYLLNDSTSEDSAQEYTIVWATKGVLLEIESVTFGWMSTDSAEKFLREMLNGKYNNHIYRVCSKKILETENHKCALCA